MAKKQVKQGNRKASPSRVKPQGNKKQAGAAGRNKPSPSTAAAGDRTPAADKDGRGPATPTSDQKRVLDVFADVFAAELASDGFAAALQNVKQALFERDFAAAFGAEANLRVYAARYSPTRALCYADALSGIATHLDGLLSLEQQPLPLIGVDDENGSSSDTGGGGGELKVLAIGGAAAEVAALAAFLHPRPRTSASVVLLDSGPWGPVVNALAAGLTTAPAPSSYISEEARASSSRALVEPASRLGTAFIRADALGLDADGYHALAPGTAPCLVTLLFTLNELFTAGGIGKTTAFLLSLSAGLPSGSLLLVMDSPGSYSETAVGKESKRYPMSWLLDKVLSTVEDCEWAKLESHDSVWFRLPAGLKYPISLENMRYQMHLYRVTKPTSPKR